MLREIAFANTVAQYKTNLDPPMASSVYNNLPRVQRYLKAKWWMHYSKSCVYIHFRHAHLHSGGKCIYTVQVAIYHGM